MTDNGHATHGYVAALMRHVRNHSVTWMLSLAVLLLSLCVAGMLAFGWWQLNFELRETRKALIHNVDVARELLDREASR